MTPEEKGNAIGDVPELAKAHNWHAPFVSVQDHDISAQNTNTARTSQRGLSIGEAFHFVSFVHLKNRLIELDGLKEYPIDHGLVESNQVWTEKFRHLMKQRVESSADLRYSLMSVIPKRYDAAKENLLKAQHNLTNLLKTIDHLVFTDSHHLTYEHNYCKHDQIENLQSIFRLVKPEPSNSSQSQANHFDQRLSIFEKESNPNHNVDITGSDTDSASEDCDSNNFEKDTGSCYIPSGRAFICKFSSEMDSNSFQDGGTKLDTNGIGHKNENSLCSKEKKSETHSHIDTMSEPLPPCESVANNLSKSSNSKSSSEKHDILNDLVKIQLTMLSDISILQRTVEEEKAKNDRYLCEDQRRVHNYDKFIRQFLHFLTDCDLLGDNLENKFSLNDDEANSEDVDRKRPNNSKTFNQPEVLDCEDSVKASDFLFYFPPRMKLACENASVSEDVGSPLPFKSEYDVNGEGSFDDDYDSDEEPSPSSNDDYELFSHYASHVKPLTVVKKLSEVKIHKNSTKCTEKTPNSNISLVPKRSLVSDDPNRIILRIKRIKDFKIVNGKPVSDSEGKTMNGETNALVATLDTKVASSHYEQHNGKRNEK